MAAASSRARRSNSGSSLVGRRACRPTLLLLNWSQADPMNPMRLIIIGGGTAGWMAAACLRRFMPDGWSVQLIESDDIGTVGVGEATIPQIRLFNDALGIDEDEFLTATQGTIKLGIEFADWTRPGHRYMHAFGAIGRGLGLLEFPHYWLRASGLAEAQEFGPYSLNKQGGRGRRMQRGSPRK